MVENRDGKSQSFDPERWVEVHSEALYGFALKYLKDKVVAEDVVQETFLAALKNRDSFAGASSEQTWLIGILKNKIVDYYRKLSRNGAVIDSEISVDPDSIDYISRGPDIGSWKPDKRPSEWSVDPNDPVEQQQFWHHLNGCLEELEPRTAICYYLRDMQQIEYKEVCNVMSLKPTNLRVILHRARKLLRRCLEVNWIEK